MTYGTSLEAPEQVLDMRAAGGDILQSLSPLQRIQMPNDVMILAAVGLGQGRWGGSGVTSEAASRCRGGPGRGGAGKGPENKILEVEGGPREA